MFKTFVCQFIVSREAGNLFLIIHTKPSNCDAQFDHLKHASCRLIRGEVGLHSSNEARSRGSWASRLDESLKAHTDRTRFGNATRILDFQCRLALIFFHFS